VADKKTSHTFSINLYGRAVPLLCTFVAFSEDKGRVRVSLTHVMTTTRFVVPVEVCEEIMIVLRNAIEDAREGVSIEPVEPAMPAQSDRGGVEC